MTGPLRADRHVAIALEDNGGGLRLLATIRRARGGDIYYMMCRPNQPTGHPHVTRHASGTTHIRTGGEKLLGGKEQPPTPSFRGVEHHMAETILPGELAARRMPCVEAAYAKVWKIPAEALDDSKQHTVVVDLVQPGQESAPTERWGRKAEENTFADDVPHIRVTIWEGVPFAKD